ncbi:MAG: class I SAM-dependent methyltransferase [Flavobacteriia bacterium]|nr:class I SAM-dependent methyltransferase [Flavobacteriia bacterium]
MDNIRIYTQGWGDYELIDAGGGKKLERWGEIITIRPEVQAYFKSEIPFKEWEQKAHFEFILKNGQTGSWKKLKPNFSENWNISYHSLQFHLELTKFKHVGLFPEQAINWELIHSKLNSNSKFLNLFAYTGAASLIARSTGAETIHVDSVKQLISWAKKNQELSSLENTKWVHEDALKFAEREVKRGNKYHGIIMDPPAWGIGAKGEKWKLEDKLELLISYAKNLLMPDGFLILNTYSPTISTKDIQRLASKHFDSQKIHVFELWMKTTTGKELYYGNGIRIA